MIRLSHRHAILFSGLVWLLVGVFLIYKGLNYMVMIGDHIHTHYIQGLPLIRFFSSFAKDLNQAALFFICTSLFLGYVKGRFALKKSVNRVVSRITSLPSPVPFKKIYSSGYFLLLCSMMAIGMGFKYLPLSVDIKGFVDFTVGAALINGSMLYLREAIKGGRKSFAS